MLMAGLTGSAQADPGGPAVWPVRGGAGTSQVLAHAEALGGLPVLRGDVFSKELIETWIAWKRENEIDPVRLRPHPAEFALYFDC
jgi:hypothetical protein